MKFPIVVNKKIERGEKGYVAFCPVFDDAETFSLCDSKREAIDEVAEIVQDEVDDLVDAGKPLPRIPSKEVLEKKYPKAKIFWVNIEETDSLGDDALFDDGEDEQVDDDFDEDDFEEGSDDEEPEDEDVDDLELDEILDDDDE